VKSGPFACLRDDINNKMKHFSIILLIIITLTSCAQPESGIDEIKNSLTKDHIPISGTGVSLIPPQGYNLASNFPGFMKDQQSAIFVSQFMNQSYEITLSENGKEYYKNKGANNIIEKQLRINGFNATLIEMSANTNNKAFGLVMGDSSSSVMIIATCSLQDSTEINSLKKSVLSIHYDKNSISSPLESANFKINLSESSFKLSDYAGGSFVFTKNGARVDFSTRHIIYVSPLPSANGNESNRNLQRMFQSMVANGFIYSKEVFTSNEDVNGYNASERVFEGDLNGEPCKMYLLILTESDGTLCFQGVIKSDYEKSINEIKRIAHNI
jgi:PBP1b-binding outer membrane lipoprotein LpoB